MDRKHVGQQRLGVPVPATFDALVNAIDRKPWSDFQREPVGYYFNNMIGTWLLRLMDGALSDRQLSAVAPDDVTAITLLLFRDMFRHNFRLLRPDTPDATWVEDLFLELASNLQLSASRLRDCGHSTELLLNVSCRWCSVV